MANPLQGFDAAAYDPSKLGGAGFGIDDYNYLLKQGATYDQIAQIAQRAVGIGPKAQTALAGVPAFPTLDSVFSDWNKQHYQTFGTYVDFRLSGPEAIQAQKNQLQPVLQAKQQEWLSKYGNTPEARAMAKEAPPTWESIYSSWEPQYVKQFGKTIDRPWYADENTINQKEALDRDYINALNSYNERYGTNFQPNMSVLGPGAQPNIFDSPKPPKKEKSFLESALPWVAGLTAAYFGAPYLAELGTTAGAAEAAGAAGAAGSAATTAAEYAAAVDALDAASGIGAMDAPAGALGGGTGITPGAAGQGLKIPTMPNIGNMGGGQGLKVPVPGGAVGGLGYTPIGAVPVLGDPSSFINNPDVLGQPVIQQGTPAAFPALSIQNILQGARLANQLLTPAQQKTPNLIGQAQETLKTQGAVDYSGLLGLLSQRAKIPGLLGTQYQPQPINIASLLG